MPDIVNLAASARRFDAFALLRQLECARPRQPRLGQAQRPQEECVRLGQNPALTFTASEVDSLQPAHAGLPARLALNLLPLTGPQGPLPLSFSEYVYKRTLHGDHSWRAFLDLFHHRLLSLYYRAWAGAQPVIAAERPADDAFARAIASLCGQRAPGCAHAAGVPLQAGWHFAAQLAGQRRPASALANILGEYFGLPVRIEPFAGEYLPLAAHECSRLGRIRQTLQQGVVVGCRVWNAQHRFRVVFGPLPRADFVRLQPDGTSFAALCHWLHRFSAGQLDWQLELQLADDDWQPAKLGQAVRLARDSWLSRPGRTSLTFNPQATPTGKPHYG